MTALNNKYTKRYNDTLNPLSKRLQKFIEDHFSDVHRIDRITARAKSIDRFLLKAQKFEEGIKKYSDPLNQIQDQIGVRIITFYIDDVPKIAKKVTEYFRPIENRTVVPDSSSEFGYFGKHYILLLPRDVIAINEPSVPPFFELQIKTLFQHAWSEANHDLGYKSDTKLSTEIKRKIAFTSAQAWGADMIFNELQKDINVQITKEE